MGVLASQGPGGVVPDLGALTSEHRRHRSCKNHETAN